MGRKYKVFLFALTILGIGLVVILTFNLNRADVLNPAGLVAHKQFDLLVFATLLMLVIVIPVFVMTFFIAWKYSEGNHKAKYTPEWDRNRKLETIWWGFPLVIILILSIVTWQSSHDLDPFKPLNAETKPLTIQVVALQWNWLFIYPEQKAATLNYVRFPEQTPVKFEITADAPMNSFWIPSLGGQMYAMSGMSTELNLMADHSGTYRGSSANISGKGFASMKFSAESTSSQSFNNWADEIRNSSDALDLNAYNKLPRPSKNLPVTYYSLADEGLYNKIIMKYMPKGENRAHAEMEMGGR